MEWEDVLIERIQRVKTPAPLWTRESSHRNSKKHKGEMTPDLPEALSLNDFWCVEIEAEQQNLPFSLY